MCQHGINLSQFEMMIEQMDDQLALNRRWLHKMAHNAGDNGYTKTDEALHKAQQLMDDARALLSDAKVALEDDAENLSGVTVTPL